MWLEREIEEEVKKVVECCVDNKSPGPDGFLLALSTLFDYGQTRGNSE